MVIRYDDTQRVTAHPFVLFEGRLYVFQSPAVGYREGVFVAEAFSIQDESRGEMVFLRLHGFLDAYTAPQFEQAIQKQVENGRCQLVVDCAGLSYISSAGLGVFMSFVEEVREKGGDIRIGGLIPKVAQVFDILGFSEIFQIFDTADTAAKSFEAEE